MSALSILIVRHAEKPGESWPGPGLSSGGAADNKSLVIRGWQRSGSWCALLGGDLTSDDFPRPDAIYAAEPTATTGDDPSQRPFETISPLAARLTLAPVLTYALGQGSAACGRAVGPDWSRAALLGAQSDRQDDPARDSGRTKRSRTTRQMGRYALRCHAAFPPKCSGCTLVVPPALPAPALWRYRCATGIGKGFDEPVLMSTLSQEKLCRGRRQSAERRPVTSRDPV
jgi:hypothetical protein